MADSVAAAFARDGFVILPGLFSRAECAVWKAEGERLLADVRREHADAGRDPDAQLASGVYVGLSQRSPVFAELTADPRLTGPVREVLGPDLAFISDKLVFKDDRTEFATPWHQDYAYWRGAHKPSLWIALDDATADNGCLKLMPGSHMRERAHDEVSSGKGFGRRIERLDETQAVAAPLAAGGAVLFHDLTLHASFPNRSGQQRWALIPTYANAVQAAAEAARWPAWRLL